MSFHAAHTTEYAERAAPDRFMTSEEVRGLTSLSRTTLKDWVKKGTFPRSYNLGGRRVGWRASEVHGWIASRYETGRSRAA